ncbi:MAG TPA: DUF6364 family protein [Gemmatimonadaceae bacterium]
MKPTNLSLDPDAVKRGERYSHRHGISLSRLVSGFLRALPLDASGRELSPAVKRLRGVAAGARVGREHWREHWREHLHEKYGKR